MMSRKTGAIRKSVSKSMSKRPGLYCMLVRTAFYARFRMAKNWRDATSVRRLAARRRTNRCTWLGDIDLVT